MQTLKTGILDVEALERKMKLHNIASFSELSAVAGVHRNSLQPYLKGEKSVYSSVFERICRSLKTSPSELFLDTKVLDRHGLFPILQQLWAEQSYQSVCCFLFGSRASGKAKKFSDYDIGLSAGINITSSLDFYSVKERILIATEDLPVSIDVVDFDNAPNWFISEIDEKFSFICGNNTSFQQLLGKVNGIKKAFAPK